MKIFYILLFCFSCGCVSTDMQTINLLNNRINALEKQSKGEVVQPRYTNPNKLNDAQKDFVEFMLNYLAEEVD